MRNANKSPEVFYSAMVLREMEKWSRVAIVTGSSLKLNRFFSL